jgi:dienelactone hydrolase
MRMRCLAFAVLLILLQPLGAKSDDAAPLLSATAEYIFDNTYKSLKKHRALAVGSYGIYAWSSGWRSDKEAQRNSLRFCRSLSQKLYPKQVKSINCEVYASDNRIVNPDLQLGEKLGVPLGGIDRPLEEGVTRAYLGPKRKGIVLYIHGCDGPPSNLIANFVGDFFIAAGFDFYAPNSFADARPGVICPTLDNKAGLGAQELDKEKIVKLRVAQTLRSIAVLKNRYPEVPIFVWGQSEGGYVVQLLNVDVAGIMVSGFACGINGIPPVYGRHIPMLYMFGNHDPFISNIKVTNISKFARDCRKLLPNKKSSVAIIEDAGHAYFPLRRDIAEKLLAFVGGGKPSLPARVNPEGLTVDERVSAALKDYGLLAKHKAFALGPRSTYGWAAGWDFAADAEGVALYECARKNLGFYFYRKEEPCSIIDVDGKSKRN